MAINRLSTGTPTSASQIPFYDPTNGQDRRASLDAIADVIQAELTPAGGLVTQYASPSATGFTVAVAPPSNGTSMFLLLTPTGAFAAGTIKLPLKAELINGQEVLVHTTQAVTTLTIDLNGATAANGAPTTLAQFAFFRLRYDSINSSWYRVG